jgi:heptaprenylglyceryl phosphate synthase
VEVVAFSGDDTNSWTYATATWRTANAGSVAHLFVRGLDEDGVHAVYDALMTVSATNAYVAVGLDSTTAKAGTAAISNNASTTMISPKYSGLPGIGFHGVYAIEYSSGATSTFYGDVGTPLLVQTGLHFRMHM